MSILTEASALYLPGRIPITPEWPDLSGNGYDGTLVNMDSSNAVQYQRGKWGLTFNGVDEYVILPHTTLGDFPALVVGSGTLIDIRSYICYDNYPDSPRNGWQIRLDNQSGINSIYSFVFVNGTGGEIVFAHADPGAEHVCFLRRTGTVMDLWVDGVQSGTTLTVGEGTVTFENGRLGSHYYSGGNHDFLAGNIVVSGIWSRALTPGEMQAATAVVTGKQRLLRPQLVGVN